MRSLISCFLFLLFASAHAQDIILRDIEGHDIPFESLKGKWVFINYWASWCHPCVDEIEELNQFYDTNKTNNIAVFAVNYDTLPLYKQQRMIHKFNIHYPSLQLNSMAGLLPSGVTVVPITFVFNPQGELLTTLYGGQTLASFNEVINENKGMHTT